MTIAEENRFYSKDQEKYKIEENKELLTWLRKSVKKGYKSYLDISDLQDFIDIIACWYEMKYPNRELENSQEKIDSKSKKIETISQYMSIEQLRYRLPHKSLLLMDCEFRMKDNKNIMIYNNDGKIIGCNDMQFIEAREYDLELREMLLQIVILKLLYSKNTTPEIGYIRAQRFVEEFNRELHLNLSLEEADTIINRAYIHKKNVINRINGIFNKK